MIIFIRQTVTLVIIVIDEGDHTAKKTVSLLNVPFVSLLFRNVLTVLIVILPCLILCVDTVLHCTKNNNN